MANLSVPSPGKWILDIFGKHIVRSFFGILESKNPTFFQVNFVGGVMLNKQNSSLDQKVKHISKNMFESVAQTIPHMDVFVEASERVIISPEEMFLAALDNMPY